MTHEYSPYTGSDRPFNPERCKASVPFGGRSVSFHQCRRKPWKDGWCKQHHPDNEAKRRAERDLRYQRETEISLSFRLAKAREEIVRLKARIAELEEQT